MDKINKILEECYEACACCRLDWEYTTTLGNGVNACEVAEFAWSIFNILEISKEEADVHIEKVMEELKEKYG